MSIGGCAMSRLPSFIFKMPKFSSIWLQNFYHCIMPSWKHPLTSSDVKWVYLYESNLSDECLPIVVTWFTNEAALNLVGSNFEILPKCLKEHRSLWELELFNCMSLKKIRGVRLNIVILSASNCKSLNFSSRSMLVNQELLNEGRKTNFCFPARGSERIPEWFEHQSIGPTRISFWFRNKIPSIALFFSTKWVCNHEEKLQLRVNLFINGHKYTFSLKEFISVSLLETNHIYLIYLDLDGLVRRSEDYEKLESKLEEAILKKEWIHMELKLESYWKSEDDSDEMMKSLRAKFGIHVLKEENNLEDVEFTNPYRKRKSYEHLRVLVSA